jgi:hypothetical protein
MLKPSVMSKCPNCNKTMSCGCQKRVTATGKVGCTSCIQSLMKSEKNIDEQINDTYQSIKNSVNKA